MLRRRAFLTATAFVLSAAPLAFLAAGCNSGSGGGGGTTGNASATTTGGASGGGNAKPEKLVFGFVPSLEADKIAATAKPMADFIAKEVGIPVETYTSTDYTGLIEAMGSGKVDIGALAPLAFVLAEDQNGTKVLLKSSRHGALTYHAIFITRADSGIKSIEDAKGKRMAWVDAASASGYLFPAAYLKNKNLDPDTFFSNTVFSGSHDNAIRAVYNGDADVASVYDDARTKVEKVLPDVKQKVVIIGKTDEIPNDTFSVRKDLDPELAEKIKQAMLKYAATPEGKKTLLDTYEIDGLAEAKSEDYDVVRKTAKSMGVDLSYIDKPKAPAASPAAAASASPSPVATAKP